MDCAGVGRKASEWTFSHPTGFKDQHPTDRSRNLGPDAHGKRHGSIALNLQIGSQHDQADERLNATDGQFGKIVIRRDYDPLIVKRPLSLNPIIQPRSILDRPSHVQTQSPQFENEAAWAAFVGEEAMIVQAAIRPSCLI